MATILLTWIIFFTHFYRTEQKPLVVTPPNLRWNATNELLITACGSTNKLVDINLDIRTFPSAVPIFRETLQAKIAGSTNHVKFFVPGGAQQSDFYRVIVRVQGDSEPFEETLSGEPDLSTVYLQTDKTVYKPTDTVRIRALPLTMDGKLYSGPVDFALVNPDGYEFIHKTKPFPGNRFHAVEFQLPEHLNFGEWKIVARPDRQSSSSYSITFHVQNYEVPPFRVHVLAKETNGADFYELDVLARHAHGTPVSGRVSVRCDCVADSSHSAKFVDSRKSTLCTLESSETIVTSLESLAIALEAPKKVSLHFRDFTENFYDQQFLFSSKLVIAFHAFDTGTC